MIDSLNTGLSPLPSREILRFAQDDNMEKAQNDKRRRTRNDDGGRAGAELHDLKRSYYSRNDDSLEGWSHHSRAF